MADEKKVRLGVDVGDVEAVMKRLDASVQQTFKNMVQASRSYTTSSREVLKDLEEQIRLLERKNKLEYSERTRINAGFLHRGQVTQETYNEAQRKSQSVYEEGNKQANLLRELIEVTKLQAKTEIRENREATEKRIAASRTVGKLSPKGEAQELLKETLQREMLGSSAQRDIQEKGMFDAAKKGVPYLSGVAGSTNIYGAAAGVAQTGFGSMSGAGGAMGLIGALGFIAAMAGGKAIQASMPYEQAMARAAGLGMGRSSFIGYGNEMSSYGYTMDQTIARRYSIGRARGTNVGSDQATKDALLLERALSLEPSQLDQLERLQRGEVSGMSTRTGVSNMINQFRGVGMIQGDDMSKVPEYLDMLVTLGNEQVKKLGSVDTGVNTRFLAAVGSLKEEIGKSPVYMMDIATKMSAGLSNSPNKQVEALQYSILSKRYPNASLADLRLKRFQGERTEGYAEDMMDFITSVSGGNVAVGMSMYEGMSNLNPQQAYDVFTSKNKVDFKRAMASKDDKGKPAINLEYWAKDATGTLMEATAVWTNSFQKTGVEITDVMKDFKNGLDDAVKKVNSTMNGMIDAYMKATGRWNDWMVTNVAGWKKVNEITDMANKNPFGLQGVMSDALIDEWSKNQLPK